MTKLAVHFHEVDEFLAELERDIEDVFVYVEREIVRVTSVYRNITAGVRTVSVVASYVSTRQGAIPAVVHVDAYAGQLWGQGEIDEKTGERQAALLEAIASACERLGLDQRAGIYGVKA